MLKVHTLTLFPKQVFFICEYLMEIVKKNVHVLTQATIGYESAKMKTF